MKYMKKLLALAVVAIGAVFCACTADYDTFGESGYKAMDEIVFEEQDGTAAFYSEEHKIKINLLAPPKGDSTWDSVTVESFDISNMASLHLVDGKFKEFPSDSASLDSLARKISYKSSKIRRGDKLRLPKNLLIYIVVVAENGDPSIWQLEFTIPGVEAVSSDSNNENSDKSSSSESSEKSAVSSSSGKSEVNDASSSSKGGEAEKDEKQDVASSSSVTLSGNNDLQVSFVGEVDNKISGDTIYVTFAQGTKLSELSVDTVIYHRNATIDEDPSKIKDWSKVHDFKVTAEDGTSKKWTVIVQAIKNSAVDLQLTLEKQLKANRSGDTIAIKLVNGSSLETAKLASYSISDGASIKPVPDEVKTWAESQKFTVTAEDGSVKIWVVTIAVAEADEKASDEKDLISISAKDESSEATIDKSKKTIVLHLANKDALASVVVNIKVSETAVHNFGTGSVNLMTPQTLIITAEDGSFDKWTISADYAKSSAAEILSFEVDEIAVSDLKIDSEKKTITFTVPYGTDLSDVFFNVKVSEGAKMTSPRYDEIDLSGKEGKIVVTAEDGSTVDWNVSVEESAPPAQAPRILGMKIAGQTAVVDSAEENGTYVYWVHYDNLTFLADLGELVVSDIQLPEDCSITGVSDGSSYDLSYGVKATVTNSEGVSRDYEIRAGYQYPNSDMEEWNTTDKKPYNWDNGNQTSGIKTYMTDRKAMASAGGYAAQMTSKNIAGLAFASGNLFIGDFNPKSVGQLKMTGYDDGNELIDFGKPFKARPRYMEVDFKYDGKKGDSCDVYIILENRSRTTNDGNNLNRSSSDVNTLVASAWYRATTDSSFVNPDIVSISGRNADGLRTLRLSLKYGEPREGSPILNVGSGEGKVSVLSPGTLHSNGIDNHVVKGDGADAVTHIRIVAASSADGNHYKGVDGSALIVDNFRLIY